MGASIKRQRYLGASSYGRPGLLSRLWRLRLFHGIALLAPALVICAWYASAAMLSHHRYAAAIGDDQPLTLEIFQLHLHDHLSRDLRRVFTPATGEAPSTLPTMNLHLSNADLDALNENLPPVDGQGSYVGGFLERDGEYWDVDARYRGRRHMHWLYAQKSWKLRVRGGGFLDGLQTFNFINTPDPMPFDELIVMELAAEQGILAPDYHPFRLLLNNAPMGIHFFSTQPDEGLLRNSKRIPGSMYSGNGAPVDKTDGVSLLWRDASYWKKVAARLGIKGAMHDFSELERLLEMVNEASDVDFADFARHHLDMKRFATFDALDVIFGGNQHDFDQNHKLYFDPYKARFEPVAWNFRGWAHRREINRTENPLQIRLKGLPGYMLLRDRLVLEFLDGLCSPAALRARIHRVLEDMGPAQRADPYWDAYHLLPPMDSYHDQLVRPMDEARQALVLAARYNLITARAEFLHEALSTVGLAMEARTVPGAPGVTAVDLVVSGRGGVRLTALSVTWPEGCAPEAWSLDGDTDLDGTVAGNRNLGRVQGKDAEIWLGMELLPGIVLVPRKPNPKRGAVRVREQARRYRLFVHGGECTPERIRLRAVGLLGDQELLREAAPEETPLPEQSRALACGGSIPPLAADFSSAHPWCHPAKAAGLTRLGPGVVEIPETRVFEVSQRVEIQPDTTFNLAAGASLVFLGPVVAKGTKDAPIRIRGAGWGGVALQGPGTAGSRLSHVIFEGGTTPAWGMAVFSGMLNLHDTRDIELSHLQLRGMQGTEDAVHMAYVEALTLDGLRVEGSTSDGLDLEFCEAQLSGLEILDSADEALDLMGGQVTVKDSVLAGFGGSGISAGEETRLRLEDSLVSGGAVGVLVKNAGRVRLRDVLVHEAGVAMDLKYMSDRYSGDARARTKRVYAMDCDAGVITDRPWKPDAPALKGAPGPDSLQRLRERVLGIEDWDALDAGLERLRGGGS